MKKILPAVHSLSEFGNPIIIGLAGARTSGKSAVADILVKHHGFTRFRFGSGLKDMLYAIGLTEEELDGDKKDLPCKKLGGVTPRYLMTTLGDGWGRRIVHPNLWVYILSNHLLAEFIKNQHIKIVIDDVRYPNEVEYIKNAGGEIWRVTRPGLHPVSLWFPKFVARWSWLTRHHVSEFYWNRIPADHVIENDLDLSALRHLVSKAIKERVETTTDNGATISRFWTPRIRD